MDEEILNEDIREADLEPGQKIRRLIKRFDQHEYSYEEMEKIPIEDSDSVQALIQGLESEEWRTVLACTTALGKARVRFDTVIPTLVKLLEHQEELIREAAVEALGNLGVTAKPSVVSLLKLLDNEKENLGMVTDIINTLGKIGEEEDLVVPLLVRILNEAQESSSDEEAVAQALTSTNAIQDLLNKLFRKQKPTKPGKDGQVEFQDNYRVISATCQALGCFRKKKKDVVPVLIEALKINNQEVRLAAARALIKFHQRPEQIVEAILALINRLAKKQDSSGNKASQTEIQELITILYNYDKMFAAIVFDLLTLPDLPREPHDEFTPVLKKFVCTPYFTSHHIEKLKDFMKYPQASVRAQSIELAGFLGQEAACLIPDIGSALDDAEPNVVERAVEALGRLRSTDQAVINKLKELARQQEKDENFKGMVRDALYRLGIHEPVPSDGIDPLSPRNMYVQLDYSFSSSFHLQKSIFFSYHRILETTHPDTWTTNADEFGVIEITPGSWDITRYDLPVNFPVQSTGAYGAKREFFLQANMNNELVFVVQSPFSDDRGWGNDNFLYSFSMETRHWCRWRGKAGDLEFRKERLCPELPENENSEYSVNQGELIAWVDERNMFRTVIDDTPYHLDTWEQTEEVEKAMQAKQKARENMPNPGYRLEISPLSDYLWVFDRQKFTSREQLEKKIPLYRVYDVKRFIMTQDRRLLDVSGAEIIPCDAIFLDSEHRRYLLILVRVLYWDSEVERRENADAIVIIDTGKAPEFSLE